MGSEQMETEGKAPKIQQATFVSFSSAAWSISGWFLFPVSTVKPFLG